MSIPSYTITTDTITVIVSGKAHTVRKGATNFLALKQAILEEDWDRVPNLLTVAKSVQAWADGEFALTGNKVQYQGEDVPSELNKRILKMITDNVDPKGLLRFWERLQKNPSWRSVQQLFPFLAHEGIPIDEDGCFLAYKGVRDDYKDKHTGRVDNSPGAVNEMPRNKISDDPRTACHYGYHVGALSYAKSFGSRVVIVKVDPADVVCVPYDSSQQKMRVSKYEVIGNWNGRTLPSTSVTKTDIGVENKTKTGVTEGPGVNDKPIPRTTGRKSRAVELDPKLWEGFDEMDEVDLLAQSLDALRKYAAHVLKIVGASKIPGGKRALVQRIIEVR